MHNMNLFHRSYNNLVTGAFGMKYNEAEYLAYVLSAHGAEAAGIEPNSCRLIYFVTRTWYRPGLNMHSSN